MPNFMNFLETVFLAIGEMTGKSFKYNVASIGAYVFTMILKMVVTIILLFLFWLIGWKTGVILVGIESSIWFLIAWNNGKLAAKIIASISYLFGMKRFPSYAYNELHMLLKPVLFSSVCLSFIAVVASFKGVKTLTFESLLLWIATFAFFYGVSYWFARNTKTVQKIMVAIILVLLSTHVLIPVQSRSIIDWAERTSLGNSNSINMTNKSGDLVKVAKGTWLFDKEIKKISEADCDVNAKIMNTIDDQKSGEPMYELLFPVSKGVYIGGNTYFVPIRLIEKIDTEQITKK